MHWTYRIKAASRPKVLLRLVQLFEQHSLSLHTLELAVLKQGVRITTTIEATPELAKRLQAKLYAQIDVHEVELLPADA